MVVSASTSTDGEVPQNRQCGLQVVKLCESGETRYSLDEEGLRSVLLRSDVRDRLVVLVSVAGAYRGGKSFILDLFLRYLKAPRSCQLSGEWLGIEKEKLDGFDWRGGSDRHTTGIHLWPEPILVDLDSGEKLAVLLMDTQGTFDHESTLGDNSMIFSLSTLVSSVQIYNLSSNIREDDLQHLQLFTEYGRLASDGKVSQTLMFLVRDWMHAGEHTYGFEGGYKLLNKRLQPSENQKKELREVREHIKSCFESIQCFLMPHPGLVVGQTNFEGSVKVLTEEFRMGLLELVPSLFDPENLSPKRINGVPIKAKHLLDLFKKYVDIFNSDTLPEAKTIFQATAEACLMLLLRDARDQYEEYLQARVSDDVSVPPSRLQHWHEEAVESAINAFNSKKKLGPQEAIDETMSQLRRELDARFSLYSLQNETKTRNSFAEAKALYQHAIEEVCEAQSKLCMHSQDLERLHRRALQDALESFAAKRNVEGEDAETFKLEQELNALYRNFCSINEQNNSTAMLEARERYMHQMRQQLAESGVSSEYLQSQHDSIKEEILSNFDAQRNIATEEPTDHYRDQLIRDIEETYRELKTRNMNSNRTAMQVAEYTYNNYITDLWGPQASCFHPRALAEMHETAKEEALGQFLAMRPESENDEFKDQLIQMLERRYVRLQDINTSNNDEASQLAFNEYSRLMDKWTQPALISILIIPFFLKLIVGLPKYQKRAKAAAMTVWNSKRRGRSFSNDTYEDQLNEKIDGAYDGYRNPVLAFLREVGLSPEQVTPIIEGGLVPEN